MGGESVRMGSRYWEKLNGMSIVCGMKVYIICGGVRVRTRLGCAFARAPLHEFGNVLTKSIKNMNQRCEDKRIWVRWCNVVAWQ